MSNFDFMNNEQFLDYPACQKLYEYATLAEQFYNSDHEKCALKVRFALEQFCVFVSELKHVTYPKRVSMLGNYWCKENQFAFIQAFGTQNWENIMKANEISRSFVHSEIPTREDIYPEMLECLYKILLWLYKELGFNTKKTFIDYDTNRITAKENIKDDGKGEIYYSPEQMLTEFNRYFPNCNTKSLCNVEKQGTKYVVKDLEGKIVSEFVASEDFEATEEEKEQLKKQLKKITNDFKGSKKRFQKEQKEQEKKICDLNNKIKVLTSKKDALSNEQKKEKKKLQQQVNELKNEKEQSANAYKKRIGELGEQYEVLHKKYEELIPIEEQRQQLQQQVKELLAERSGLQKSFREKENTLLKEISLTKKDLVAVQCELDSMRISTDESKELISKLEQELFEKEQELLYTQNLSVKNYENLQNETEKMLKEYKDKANNLEIILTNVMIENAKYKELLASQNKITKTVDYLQIVNQGISQIKEGYMLYQQNPNEQRLRMYLLKVKEHYEKQIVDLKEALKAKERELEQEKIKNQKVKEQMQTEKFENDASRCQDKVEKKVNRKTVNKRKIKKQKMLVKILLVSIFMCILFMGMLKLSENISTKNGNQVQLQDEFAASSVNSSNANSDNLMNESRQKNMIDSDINKQQREILQADEDVEEQLESKATEESEETEDPKQELPEMIEEKSTENSDNNSLSDASLKQLQQDTVKLSSPEDYTDIEGISSKLLEEISELDLTSISVWGENTKREDMYYIGKAKVPGMCKNGFNMHFMGSESKKHLCNMNNNEIIKFAFVSGNRIGHIVVATEISNLSDRLSRGSTKEDVMTVLGDEMTVTELEEPTIFADARKETAILFGFSKSNGAIICFDENEKVCDYAYIGICGSK